MPQGDGVLCADFTVAVVDLQARAGTTVTLENGNQLVLSPGETMSFVKQPGKTAP